MDDNNVVLFPGVQDVFEEELGAEVPIDKMFEAALEADLENVVISGTTKTGNIYFASTSGDPQKILWELERSKHLLMMTYFAVASGVDYLDEGYE